MTVLLSWLKVPTEATLAVKGAPHSWYELDAPLRPWPPRSVVLVKAAGAGLAKRAPKLIALQASGEIVLRRSLIAPLLEGLPGVVLRPAALATQKGAVVDPDFALLDVRAHAPLDRQSADAIWTRPKAPSAALLDRLRVATWDQERRPRARIFRVGEAWNEIAAEPELAEALTRATKKWFGVRAVEPAELAQRAVFMVHPKYTPDFDQDAAAARAAESAYWKLEGGETGAALRSAACSSPIWAYWLARTVDAAARPDTRRAAFRHPVMAALYALFVQGAPSKEAERAVASESWSALRYAQLVARALPEALAPCLREAGYDPDEVEGQIDEVWRFAAPPKK